MDPKMIHLFLRYRGHEDDQWLEEISMRNSIALNFGLTNIKIEGVIIKLPGHLWTDEYLEPEKRLPLEEILEISRKMNKLGFRVILIFNRRVIPVKEIKDEYCRHVLKIFSRGFTGNLILTPARKIHTLIWKRYTKLDTFNSLRTYIETYDGFTLLPELMIRYGFIDDLRSKNYDGIINHIINLLDNPFMKKINNFIEPYYN